jgi:hypothetical protein
MNVKKRAKKIKEKLDSIMSLTFHDCKSSDPEVAAQAQNLNTLAHQCTKELEKLVSDCKKQESDWGIDKGKISGKIS